MRGEIKAWWEQALADMETAELTLKGGRYYASVFFSEQAVEKALKALVLRMTRNPQSPDMFSHSLIHLAKACHVPETFHGFLRMLTSEYVNTRYPSAAAAEPPTELYDEDRASKALSSAKDVIEWIKKRL